MVSCPDVPLRNNSLSHLFVFNQLINYNFKIKYKDLGFSGNVLVLINILPFHIVYDYSLIVKFVRSQLPFGQMLMCDIKCQLNF